MKNLIFKHLLFVSIVFIFTISAFDYAQSKAPSHEIWNTLLQKHVTPTGKVNYIGFIADSIQLNKYLKLLSDNKPDDNSWTSNEIKAYWINAYNAFTVKLVTMYYPVKSIKDIGSTIQIPFVNTPWDIKFIKIGGEKYDLNNIEHGILRKKYNDARIHFALVCAAKSCPILLNEAYIPEKLDAQLDKQGKVFLSDKTRNDVSADNPKLSKLFDWYSMDFKTTDRSVIDFVNQFAPVKINNNASVEYLDYKWDLNE